jgi:hypothetical protein
MTPGLDEKIRGEVKTRQKSSSHIPHVTARLLSDIVASHFGHELLPTLCLFNSLLGNGVELIKFDAIFFPCIQ